MVVSGPTHWPTAGGMAAVAGQLLTDCWVGYTPPLLAHLADPISGDAQTRAGSGGGKGVCGNFRRVVGGDCLMVGSCSCGPLHPAKAAAADLADSPCRPLLTADTPLLTGLLLLPPSASGRFRFSIGGRELGGRLLIGRRLAARRRPHGLVRVTVVCQTTKEGLWKYIER